MSDSIELQVGEGTLSLESDDRGCTLYAWDNNNGPVGSFMRLTVEQAHALADWIKAHVR